ncbi:hypothetical protein [Falsiruegeria mediterranea]|uniref:Uncharacterized protein n=1 Tax=Falsiruegeria mediterranea M17 TaxID=1200281 RepID=A0A2R8CB16_9RHOB|nr:hypothetical protein [Falsiruegeria mediterranea]SPJ29573.1 hypothetical protein TRM7615_03093 [Falsiruegeria mediterranea M17]
MINNRFAGIAFLTSISLFMPIESFAAEQEYHCKYGVRSKSGWVPEEAVYVIDLDEKKAVAFDSHIKFSNETPMQAKFRQRTNGEYKLAWNLKSMPSRRKRTVEGMVLNDYETTIDAHYQAWLNPKTMAVKMRVSVGRTTDTINGKGSCKLVK